MNTTANIVCDTTVTTNKPSKAPVIIAYIISAILSCIVVFGVIDYVICDIMYVNMIQESRLDNSKYTFKEAFDRYFNGEWQYFYSDDGRDIVEYSGVDSSGTNFTAQWNITQGENIKEVWYQLTYCSYGGVSLLDGGIIGYGAAALGLYTIMNY